MFKVKGRRKCDSCGKRYNYYYTVGDKDAGKVKYKGKNENASLASDVKILSMNSCMVTVNCPECGFEEKFVYTE